MKSSIFKLLVLPVAAFALASAGAVSTNAKKDGTLSITGYVHQTSTTSCDARTVDCSSNPGQTCMSADAIPLQVWKYNALNTACDQQLFKP